jgi:hypothetical protein
MAGKTKKPGILAPIEPDATIKQPPLPIPMVADTDVDEFQIPGLHDMARREMFLAQLVAGLVFHSPKEGLNG